MIDYAPLISAAIQRNMNVIASSNDEYDFSSDLLKAFQTIEVRMTHFNLQIFSSIDLFLHPLDSASPTDIFPSYVLNSEVLCFTHMEHVDAEMMQAIQELMKSRSLRGVKLPNLRSVLISYDFEDSLEEFDRLQHLAPAVTIAFS
jgi:hypothetical protein